MGNTENGLELRISLDGIEPQIWRSIRVPESIELAELHRVIQLAFGWEDRHLHQFTAGTDTDTRRILSDEETAQEIGVESETAVLLTSVLETVAGSSSAGVAGSSTSAAGAAGQAATLSYEYDFGDSWDHTIAVTGRCLLQQGQITCIGGGRRGPVEDSGGASGYTHLSQVLANPRHPEYEDLADWYAGAASAMGRFVAAPFDAEAFDVDAANARLARFAMLRSAGPPTETEVDAVVRPVRWLLQRAGTAGLELTAAGYLKPAVVRAAVAELGWQERCYGTINREDQAVPVLELRENCVRWKLLRKTKGRLVRTPAARKIADDDAALWAHVAERFAFPGTNAEDLVHRVIVGWLLEDTMPDRHVIGQVLADILNNSMFRMAGGGPVEELDSMSLHQELRWALGCLDLREPEEKSGKEGKLTLAGIKFLLDVRRRRNRE
ncbi:plasmid pRiA4b ORF-3 family protein [Paeniglutamicibacter antarcticus]|uniref:Plasmid pRiA4b ORF-3 family protein n=1 Tax=Arthrobacter terrae TaxID=2935737 RepID=A0A931CTR6_9MICC|nr:plasmid pRiA4b ORF-3 family protein [Arthrobacter terrae]MBG0740769.1 plasmid pRiA4b ORF-3 family protein [Arthrobacter terrae]